VHHTVLLWPMPQLLVAVTLAGISERLKRFGKVVASAVTLLVVASNLLVLGQYGKQLSRRELTTVWTDAIFPLAGYLETMRGYRQVTMDWGIVNSLCLLKKCTLPSAIGTGYLSGDSLEVTGLKGVAEMMADGRNIYISHIPGAEVFARENERFRTIARDNGYRRDILRVIHDGRGRPVFEVYRLRPADRPER